ncbi:MAG: PhzF family phenazine biosynthesis protein [Nocardioides sp.]|jgi:PhzF family phenazine biosynthesis protein
MRHFSQVDVFGSGPQSGNPLAVVHDAEGLTTEEMQRFARWTNLSETTFLLPPTTAGADYRVRIFTPAMELPFAGHPTLGSAHAWLVAGGRPQQPDLLVQECGVGLVRVRRGEQLAFAAPPRTRSGPLDDATLARVARALRVAPEAIVEHEWLVNGPEWIGVRLSGAAEVLALTPDFTAFDGMDIGVVGLRSGMSDSAIEVRAFIPVDGFAEDPVTGSLNAAIAQWLIGNGTLPPSYVASQGTLLGRRGRIHIESDGAEIWVGGETTMTVAGTVRL